MNSPDLTISIVSYNTRNLLRDCLNSVYENVKNINFEVIVVDNNSIDDSLGMVKKEFPQVTLIKNKENVGFAKANNQAFNRGKGRFFLLLNSDTKVLSDSIEEMIEFMDLHPDVGAVGCKQIHPDGSIQPTINIALNMWTNLWLIFLRLFQVKRLVSNSKQVSFMTNYLGGILGKTVNSYLNHYLDKREPYEVDWVSGVCLLARRETINEVGLLDENFFMYSEDVDWCLRMKQKGWKIYFLPAIKIVHYIRQSSNKGQFDNISPQRFKSIFYFFKKHYGKKAVILLKILVISSISIQMKLFLILYFLSDEKEAVKVRLKNALDLLNLACFSNKER